MDSYCRRLGRLFGSCVKCRFIDYTDRDALSAYSKAAEMLERGDGLPICLVDGEPVMSGLFAPTRIDYEIRRILTATRGVNNVGVREGGF